VAYRSAIITTIDPADKTAVETAYDATNKATIKTANFAAIVQAVTHA
jgi:hypothetical protein